jgi:hypothetical protein
VRLTQENRFCDFLEILKRFRSFVVVLPRSGTWAGRNNVQNGLPCEGEPAVPGSFTPFKLTEEFASANSSVKLIFS